jgi:hypothetical protein
MWWDIRPRVNFYFMCIVERFQLSRRYCVALYLARFKVLERKMLKTTEKVRGKWRNPVRKEFVICILHKTLLGW